MREVRSRYAGRCATIDAVEAAARLASRSVPSPGLGEHRERTMTPHCEAPPPWGAGVPANCELGGGEGPGTGEGSAPTVSGLPSETQLGLGVLGCSAEPVMALATIHACRTPRSVCDDVSVCLETSNRARVVSMRWAVTQAAHCVPCDLPRRHYGSQPAACLAAVSLPA